MLKCFPSISLNTTWLPVNPPARDTIQAIVGPIYYYCYFITMALNWHGPFVSLREAECCKSENVATPDVKYVSVCLSVCLFVCLTVYLCLSTYDICLTICLCLPVCLLVCLPDYLSLSACLSA